MSKLVLWIFAGANGSGKTTIALDITKQQGIPFINADEIAYGLEGEYEEVVGRASRIFLEKFNEGLVQKKTFAVESTLSGKTISSKIKKAKENGFQIVIIYLFLNNPQSNIERVKVRVKKGGHHVKDSDVIRRFYRSKNRFWINYRKLSDLWVLMYNSTERLQIVGLGKRQENPKIYDQNLFDAFMEQVNE